jgi:hypothetical protein
VEGRSNTGFRPQMIDRTSFETPLPSDRLVKREHRLNIHLFHIVKDFVLEFALKMGPERVSNTSTRLSTPTANAILQSRRTTENHWYGTHTDQHHIPSPTCFILPRDSRVTHSVAAPCPYDFIRDPSHHGSNPALQVRSSHHSKEGSKPHQYMDIELSPRMYVDIATEKEL